MVKRLGSFLMLNLYLELGQVVFSQWSSVTSHRNIAVQFSQAGLTHFCPVLAQVLLSKIKLAIQKY